ncbi:MAG: hydroxymethylglutaryl-CoA lyase [Chloroflexota bacterium]
MILSKQVTIVEVGPRDGFQMESGFIPTDQKIKIIDRLSETGIKRIEATSFVHPRAIPQLADAAEVMAGIQKKEGVIYEALVPNARGVERAIQAGVKHIGMVVSASESHNQRNVNMTVAESMKTLAEAAKLALNGHLTVTAAISTAFGCPIEGWVPPQKVQAITGQFLNMGVHELSLADTTGMANPSQVSEMVRDYLQKFQGSNTKLRLHFHDTRGAGLANTLAALLAGATIFDSSIAGLGGCPFAPGATGNIASADTVNMMEAMGIATGIDLEKLIECEKMVQNLLGRQLPGEVMKAGPTPWALNRR